MKKKILLSVDEEIAELLDKGSKELGTNKSKYISMLIKDNVENRLSRYIARDIENVVLYLLLQQNTDLKNLDKNNIIKKLEFIHKQTNTIKSAKSIFLKNNRNKKNNELKNFWNKILEMLEPTSFINNVGTNGKLDMEKTKKFIAELYKLVKQNKNLWNK